MESASPSSLPVEIYTPERRAAFLLSNAVDTEDYERARQEILRQGINPDSIPHTHPSKA
jgi:hypothetical protein